MDIFNRCIKRAENLISICEVKTMNTECNEDCYRAAVVLSISALDAYIRQIIINKILYTVYNNKLNNELSAYLKYLFNIDTLLSVAIKGNFKEKLESLIEADFQKQSFQGISNITHFMKMIGHDNIFKEVSSETDKNEDNLKKDIAKYTKRRHIIAHRGDYDLDNTEKKENTITKDYADNCIKTIKKFAQTINLILEK